MIENLNAWAGKVFLVAVLCGGAYFVVEKMIAYRPPTTAELEARDPRENPYLREVAKEHNQALAEIQRQIDQNMAQNAAIANEVLGQN